MARTIAAALALLWLGCSAEGTHQLAPADGGGFCCPIETPTCNCFGYGGWIATDSSNCPKICDLGPQGAKELVDGHGCKYLTSPSSCLALPSDGGSPDSGI